MSPRSIADQGFYFTINVEALHSQHIQTIARKLPSELILIETDNSEGPQGLIGDHGRLLLIRDVI